MNLWMCHDSAIVQKLGGLPMQTSFVGEAGKATPRELGRTVIASMRGVITKYGHDESDLPAGTSSARLESIFNQLAADDGVSGVVLDCESPGGHVSGITEAADAFARLSKMKPTVCYVDGMCCSAAYFIASQARKIIASRGSILGSVGTAMICVDQSAMFASIGVKFIPITTSGVKLAGHPLLELTPEQKEYLQSYVDSAQSFFDEAVMSGRKMSQNLFNGVKTGGIFHSNTAQQLKMIDAVGSFDDALKAVGYDAKAIRETGRNGGLSLMQIGRCMVEEPAATKAEVQPVLYGRNSY